MMAVTDEPAAPLDINETFYDGELATLSKAGTQYRMYGELLEKKPLIICIHGINTGHYQFQQLAEDLSLANSSVLVYDLYGRGGSGDPNTDHTLQLFVGQLAELIFFVQHKLNRVFKVVLVGQSMGAAIATAFANAYPQVVEKIVLMSPVGLPASQPIVGKLMKMPLIGEGFGAMMRSNPEKMAEIGARAFADPENPATAQLIRRTAAFIKNQCQHKEGYMKGLLSTLRHFPLTKMREDYAELGRKNIPTLLLWGDQDKIAPFENATLVQDLIPHVKFVALAGCSHVDHFGVKYHVMRGSIQEFLSAKSTM
eukprot:m.262528 g.262528  ORF g.262528 m.262528 type:complete len:311 (-) comp45984_c0_seq1:212-1144(-)